MITAKASIEHLDKLFEIEMECFAQEAFTKHQLSCLLADPDSVALISKIREEIAGFVIGKIYADNSQAFGHILTIDVLPSHRHKGIGRRLLQEIEMRFKAKGVKICCLEVRENNIPALSLYQQSGYNEVAKLSHYYGDGHGIRLRKILT